MLHTQPAHLLWGPEKAGSKPRGQSAEAALLALYLLQSLHYADLDHCVLGRPRRMSTVLPGDARTVYAVVV